ncbi:MAG TPA: hypothetical protein VGR44_10650 [Methylomirabilota bacterium]|jgi:hypothetical protein|nr:hypothetical protein [Methylomirabilota bacterium]
MKVVFHARGTSIHYGRRERIPRSDRDRSRGGGGNPPGLSGGRGQTAEEIGAEALLAKKDLTASLLPTIRWVVTEEGRTQ